MMNSLSWMIKSLKVDQLGTIIIFQSILFLDIICTDLEYGFIVIF